MHNGNAGGGTIRIGVRGMVVIGGTMIATDILLLARSRITSTTAKDMAIIGGMAVAIVTPDNVKISPLRPNVSQMDVIGMMLPVTERLQNARI
ncbi:hypothetical protein J7M00_08305 [bacterium]|nr:hypothetical protein [bacterium]